MADPQNLTRWVGVGIALAGSFVVSPEGTRRLLGQSFAAVQMLAGQLRSWLAGWLPFLRRDTPVHVVIAELHLQVGAPTASVSATTWGPDETVEAKVERLHTYVEELRSNLNELRAQTGERHKS